MGILSVEMNQSAKSWEHWKLRPCTTAQGRGGGGSAVWPQLHENATWREQGSVHRQLSVSWNTSSELSGGEESSKKKTDIPASPLISGMQTGSGKDLENMEP